METTTSPKQELNCRVIRSLLRYVESLGYDADSILEGLPYSKEYLTDPSNWITHAIGDTICQQAAKLVNDEAIMYQVGLAVLTLDPLSSLEHLISFFNSPKLAYMTIPKRTRFFDQAFQLEEVLTGDNKATITMLPTKECQASKHFCYYTQGLLASIPMIRGMPPAKISEKQCMWQPPDGVDAKGVKYGTETCTYEVIWQEKKQSDSKLGNKLVGGGHSVSTAIKDLQTGSQLSDKANSELFRRYAQLSEAWGIALGIGTVGTVDEVWALAVELGRDIPGVRFVAVLQLDQSGRTIITPYYSKIRTKSVARALKAVGFDPDKQLGKAPTSRKLQFPVAKSKVAQDFLSHPRVLVSERLSELTRGAVSKALCDSIQRVANLKKFVGVPIMMPEGESTGLLFFFLDEEVPQDILEMVAAYCSIALKNVSALEAVVKRNTQLAKVREIALGIDSVNTASQLFRLVVELARDIPGVRFVAIGKLEESGHLVTIPYYSKIRGRAIARALKAVGFDPEQQLGKEPTSQKMKYPVARLKIIHDSLKNPRVIVKERLSEFMESLWSKTLCDAIQRITNTRKFVSVPIMPRGEPWGSLIFFLEDEIPQDILEMVGAHFVTALENVTNLESLERTSEELRKSNEFSLYLIEQSPHPILVTNREGTITRVNRALKQLTGYSSSELIGLKAPYPWWTDQKPKQSRGGDAKATFKATGESYEEKFRKKNGEIFWVEITPTTLIVDEKSSYWVTTWTDITKRRDAEAKKVELERKAHLASHLATIGKMASGIAHEINTPISSIILLTELMSNKDIPDSIRDDLMVVNQEAQRVAIINKRLLTFARPQKPQKLLININDIIARTLNTRTHQLETGNITVTTEFAPNIPLTLADAAQLQQVFLNIILNAETEMKMAHGKGELYISTEAGEGIIRIRFKDNGSGIPKENLERIFDPFFTTRPVGQGTGLGLSVCHGIITEHGGRIYAQNNSGKGATFAIELPFQNDLQ